MSHTPRSSSHTNPFQKMSIHNGIRILPTGEISVALVGECAVGKTEIARVCQSRHALLNPGDRMGVRHTPTIGIEPFAIRTRHDVRGTVWDISAGPSFRHLVSANVKFSKVVCIIFDLTRSETFDKVQYWYDLVAKEKKGRPCTLLVGNKRDLATQDRAVAYQDAVDLGDLLGMPYYECSAAEVNSVLDLMQHCDDLYRMRMKSGSQAVTLTSDDEPTDMDSSVELDTDSDNGGEITVQDIRRRSWCRPGHKCVLM